MKNIEFLIDGNGDLTIGRVGPVRCAAIAADGDQMLAALVRRPDESLAELLARLDAALESAWEGESFVDEINGPSGTASDATKPSGSRSRRTSARARSGLHR